MAKLEGPDVSIEISLKEYGLAWKIGETETRFYYGTTHVGDEYTGFDWGDLENNVDVCKEYDWADFQEVLDYVGMNMKDWEKMPLTQKIQDLLSYYGAENIFGEYTEPMAYREVVPYENLKTYKVYSLDVWGNAEDGYTVNDRQHIKDVELSEDMEDPEILQELHEAGILVDPKTIKGVEVLDDCWPDINIDEDGKPILQLMAEEGN